MPKSTSKNQRRFTIKAACVLRGRREGEICPFPGTEEEGIRSSYPQYLAFCRAASILHESISHSCASALSNQFSIPLKSSIVLSRCAVVRLNYFYLDRLLRFYRLVEIYSPQSMAVEKAPPAWRADTVEQFERLTKDSVSFNQAMLVRLSPLWNLPVTEPPGGFRKSFEQDKNQTIETLDWNLRIPDPKKRSVLKKISKEQGRIPVLYMAYETNALYEKGVYGPGLLKDICDDEHHLWMRGEMRRNAALRKTLLGPALEKNKRAFRACLKKLGLAGAEFQDHAFRLFKDYFMELYPVSLLEYLPIFFEISKRRLRAVRTKTLITTEIADSRTAYALAAARALKMEIIGCQHGAHYGYKEDMVEAEELEYSLRDRFITWGWKDFPPFPAYKSIKTAVPLPSPFFSQKKAFWRKNKKLWRPGLKKPFNVLLMPSHAELFPRALSESGGVRCDHLKDWGEFLENLIRRLCSQGFRVLHKPRNPSTVIALRKTLERMKRAGGKNYQCLDALSEGLSPELVKKCSLVLWDQAASGFFECMLSGIPTLAYWDRSFTRELPDAAPFFNDLEKTGLLHRNLETLLEELERFRKNPGRWMRDPVRKEAAAKICRRYAWTEPDWDRYWKKFVRSLN